MTEIEIKKTWILKVKALFGKVSRQQIADEIGIDKKYVNEIIKDHNISKLNTKKLDDTKKYSYSVGNIRKGSIVNIVKNKRNSSYVYFENENLDIVDDFRSFFVAKSKKTGFVTAISKSDIHTNKISCKVVG